MKLPNPSSHDLNLQLNACQSKSRRNGKVARLPQDLRDQINHMLDDGVPYKTIIESLGDAGKHLNEDNISNWRLGGYQDYVKAQVINDRARTQIEAAADVIRDSGNADPVTVHRACQEIALVQYMRALIDHGDQLSRASLIKNPAKMISLMNATCNIAATGLAIDKFKRRNPPAPNVPTLAHESNLPEPNRTDEDF